MMGWDLEAPVFFNEYDSSETVRDPFIAEWVEDYFKEGIKVPKVSIRMYPVKPSTLKIQSLVLPGTAIKISY